MWFTTCSTEVTNMSLLSTQARQAQTQFYLIDVNPICPPVLEETMVTHLLQLSFRIGSKWLFCPYSHETWYVPRVPTNNRSEHVILVQSSISVLQQFQLRFDTSEIGRSSHEEQLPKTHFPTAPGIIHFINLLNHPNMRKWSTIAYFIETFYTLPLLGCAGGRPASDVCSARCFRWLRPCCCRVPGGCHEAADEATGRRIMPLRQGLMDGS